MAPNAPLTNRCKSLFHLTPSTIVLTIVQIPSLSCSDKGHLEKSSRRMTGNDDHDVRSRSFDPFKSTVMLLRSNYVCSRPCPIMTKATATNAFIYGTVSNTESTFALSPICLGKVSLIF